MPGSRLISSWPFDVTSRVVRVRVFSLALSRARLGFGLFS